jgi:hypothetical protein
MIEEVLASEQGMGRAKSSYINSSLLVKLWTGIATLAVLAVS